MRPAGLTSGSSHAMSGRSTVVALAGRRIDAHDADDERFPLARIRLVAGRLRIVLGALHCTTLVSSAANGADLVALTWPVSGASACASSCRSPSRASASRPSSIVPAASCGAGCSTTSCDEARAAGDLVRALARGKSDREAFDGGERAHYRRGHRAGGRRPPEARGGWGRRLGRHVAWQGRRDGGVRGAHSVRTASPVHRCPAQPLDTAGYWARRHTRSLAKRIDATEQKRLLALDGGGIRGLITLEVLAEIERRCCSARPGRATTSASPTTSTTSPAPAPARSSPPASRSAWRSTRSARSTSRTARRCSTRRACCGASATSSRTRSSRADSCKAAYDRASDT